jgi:hypothetical protein
MERTSGLEARTLVVSYVDLIYFLPGSYIYERSILIKGSDILVLHQELLGSKKSSSRSENF